ncbi:MAG: arginase family protein, partial [Actinobacteria bacterium]|nr:arginase family protein [Actinomycetota bacterium]
MDIKYFKHISSILDIFWRKINEEKTRRKMKIIKIPFSGANLGRNEGCEKAPEEIVKALNKVYLGENFKSADFDIDLVKVDKSNIDTSLEKIYKKAKDIKTGIFIGGDHSITYSCFKAFSEKSNKPGLIVFDAHADSEVTTKSVTHEDFIRKLIEDKILKPENLILVGLRNFTNKEISFLIQNKIKFFDMKKIFEDLENVCDTIMELARNFDSLYISIDIDVVDPSAAPGTGCLEPAGLSARELVYFIQRLKLLKNLKI